MQDTKLIEELKKEALKTQSDLEEARAAKEKKNKEKSELLRKDILKETQSMTFYGLANNICKYSYSLDHPDYYHPYLIDFETLLEKIKVNNNNLSERDLKIKLDLIKQVSKMKSLPPLDTICHIESDKWRNSSRFRYFLKKFFLRQKKYRIVFHKYKRLEDKFVDNFWAIHYFGISIALIVLGIIGILPLLAFKFLPLFIVFIIYILWMIIFC